MFNKIKGLFSKKVSKSTNDQVLAIMQQQAEVIKSLQEQLALANANTSTNTVVNNVGAVPNSNVKANVDHLAEEQAKNYESTVDRSSYGQSRSFSGDFDNADWRELSRTNPEVITCMVNELRESLVTSLNPNFYVEVLEGARSELLQQYYMMKLLQRGQYDPEKDNLDSLSKDELISAIYEVEVQDWEQRQINKGKTPFASPKQIELLKKNNVDTTNIKYWFEASKHLEAIFGSYDNTVTKAQTDLIAKLVGELQLQGYDMSVSTKKEASVKIEELSKLHEEKFGAKQPTKAQYELYARYLKLNNKRLTQSAKDKMMAMSQRELSNAITELRKQYNAEHPECSEGQANYIISLCDQLMKPCDKAMVRTLDKVTATKRIDELSRELLFTKMRRTMVSITMEEINKLTKDEVKAKLDEFRPQR